MRSILLALLLWPALGAAEIPVVALTPTAELVKSDGQPFGPVTAVAIDGDQIAVLSGTDFLNPAVYLFSRQGNGRWLQTGQFNPPPDTFGGVTAGGVFDVQLQGKVIVYQRAFRAPDLDVQLSLVHAVEQQGSDWVNTLTAFGSGVVRIIGDDMAINVVRGVTLLHRRPSGVWERSAVLPELGYSSVGDNEKGPLFEFDGNRLLIVTSVGVNAAGSTLGYANAVGQLYQRDANDNWSLAATLPTEWSSDGRTPFSGGGRGVTSLAGDHLSLIGNIFHRNPYGYWERTGDVLPVTASLSEVALAELRRSGVGLVNGQDLYRRGSDGLWHPRLRLSARVAAIDDHAAVTVERSSSAGSTQNRLFVVNLDTADASVPVPATISGLQVRPAAALSGQTVKLTAKAYVHGNVSISKMEARAVGTGVWQPMAAVDGAFDETFESAQVDVTAGRFCIRVTDSAGRISELLDEGSEPCPVVAALGSPPSSTDNQPPSVSEVTIVSPRVAYGQDNAIYAFADEGDSGSGLVAMQYRIDDGVWRSMKPFPGPSAADFYFNLHQYKAAQGVFPPAIEIGTHSACVRGIDNAGNVSEPQCVNYEVTY